MRHRPDDALSGRLYRTSSYPEDRMTDPTTDVPVERPNPLRKAASIATAVWSAAGAVVGLAVQFSVLTAAQGAAITDIGNALPGWILALGALAGAVIPFVAALGSAFHTASAAKQDVTPVSDPRDVDGHKLVRVDGGVLGGRSNVSTFGGER